MTVLIQKGEGEEKPKGLKLSAIYMENQKEECLGRLRNKECPEVSDLVNSKVQ